MNDIQQEQTIDETLFELLQIVAKLTRTQLDEQLETNGITGAKLWSMSHIAGQCGSGIGITQLADAMQCGKSNATQIVDRMESEHLVERIPNPDDRRSIIVQLTDDGQALYEEGMRMRREKLVPILKNISSEERQQLVILLQKLVGA